MARKGLGDRSQRHDPAYLRAKREKFASRAIYKLEEVDKKFRLFKTGQQVLDLGCWPGSWLQYAINRTGDDSTLVGIDLKEVTLALPKQVTTIVGDVYKLKPQALVRRYGPFDLVMSDMAPNTTGNVDADIHDSEEVFLRALEIADGCLRPGGGRFPELIRAVKDRFQTAKPFRPGSTRKSSREQYIVGRGLKASKASSEVLEHQRSSRATEPPGDDSPSGE
jgi:23S rRNA (uridine2552-2'-O)-methyltransferase